MKLEYVFYTVGTLFALATIIYFTWEYLFELGRAIKIAALALLTIGFYCLANYMKGRDL